MMKLFYTKTSPYARKARILAQETGLAEKISLIEATPYADDSDLGQTNPIGKVPALVTETGMVLIESSLVCEYLDSLHDKQKFFPPVESGRWRALRRQAIAGGIMDAGALCRQEALREENLRSSKWVARQQEKIARGLDALESEAEDGLANFTIGEISIACCLGFLDFRKLHDWRPGRPILTRWYEAVVQRPSLVDTVPVD